MGENELKKVKTAVIGCGMISGIYLTNLTKLFSITDVVAVCDIKKDSAEAAAKKFHIPKALTIDETLADPEIELCVNLTGPEVHYSLIKKCLESGKHVWTEKMLCFDFEQGKELIDLAHKNQLYLGVAPDTFLGAGLQTARQVIESGLIGKVTSVSAAINRNQLLNSEFFGFIRRMGGGLPYDVGIYYLTALLSLIGPVHQVTGFTKTPTHYTATQYNRGLYGQSWDFACSNTMVVSLLFKNGVLGTMHFNGESINAEQNQIMIYGNQGILCLGDPNTFDGYVKLVNPDGEICDIPLNHGYSGKPFVGTQEDANMAAYGHRGIGAAEMCWAMREGRNNRASKEMGLHAVEVFAGAEKASNDGRIYNMTTTFEKPMPLPAGYMDSTFSGMFPIDAEISLIH